MVFKETKKVVNSQGRKTYEEAYDPETKMTLRTSYSPSVNQRRQESKTTSTEEQEEASE